MKELSLHILDIVQNSIRAQARRVDIIVRDGLPGEQMEIVMQDDGQGMDAETLRQVREPFFTSRSSRETGLGIPLFQMAVEGSGGTLSIESAVGQGTTVRARFIRSHIDAPPLGDMRETMRTLIQGAPDMDFSYRYEGDKQAFVFDTKAIREILEDVPLNEPEVLAWIGKYLEELEACAE